VIFIDKIKSYFTDPLELPEYPLINRFIAMLSLHTLIEHQVGHPSDGTGIHDVDDATV
jgi:hypothetical protein